MAGPPGQLAKSNKAYAGWTEEIIGDWFAAGGGRRERTVLATKVYGAMGDWPNDGKLSALSIRRALRRLFAPAADRPHRPLSDAPCGPGHVVGGDLAGDGPAHRAGKVLYVGSSNFAEWDIVRANEEAARRNILGLVSEQSIYNLMTRDIELEVLPAARQYGVGIIPSSPPEGGLLAGVLGQEGRRRQAGRSREGLEANRNRIEAYEKLCASLGENPANVALAWLLHQQGVTGPIIGPRTLEQLNDSQRAAELEPEPTPSTNSTESSPGTSRPPNSTPGRSTALIVGRQ